MNLNLGLGGGEQWEGGRGPPRGVPSRATPYLSPVGTIPWGESPLP